MKNENFDLDRNQAYIVSVITEDTEPGRCDQWKIDDCADADEARQLAQEDPGVEDVVEIEPFVERVELAAVGTTDDVVDFLERIAEIQESSPAHVEGRNPDAAVVPLEGDLDDAESRAFAVDDWREVFMRVTGVRDDLGDGDGMEVHAGNFAVDDSAVEFVVGDQCVAKVTKDPELVAVEDDGL